MPIIFDNTIVSRIQQATDIVEVVSEHLSLQKKGKEMVLVGPQAQVAAVLRGCRLHEVFRIKDSLHQLGLESANHHVLNRSSET